MKYIYSGKEVIQNIIKILYKSKGLKPITKYNYIIMK